MNSIAYERAKNSINEWILRDLANRRKFMPILSDEIESLEWDFNNAETEIEEMAEKLGDETKLTDFLATRFEKEIKRSLSVKDNVSVKKFREILKNGPFAWPGGYPLFGISKDCNAICFDCMEKERERIEKACLLHNDNSWEIIAVEINYEDNLLFCDCCSNRIESAYAESEGESEKT